MSGAAIQYFFIDIGKLFEKIAHHLAAGIDKRFYSGVIEEGIINIAAVLAQSIVALGDPQCFFVNHQILRYLYAQDVVH